ncbi:UNVERIFIED_CONTAM: hypothetical protein GTU68_002044 [Idotea baltica]|nr:hypothetical protein [Idotea baltica]
MKNLKVATFGAGCFWCVEAVFQLLDGVEKVESGYANGLINNPTYREVCSSLTGHAEVCKVFYNAEMVSYAELLEVFWKTHDPTTLNRQGNDVGTQYRSGIYFETEEEQTIALKSKEAVEESGVFDDPIVTEIVALSNYTTAEEDHQNYFKDHPEQAFCFHIIGPKVDKFKKLFKEKLKEEA